MASKWNREDTEHFIYAMQQHPCLYNIKSVEYLDRTKKAQAFNEILEDISKSIPNVSVQDLKQKWKTLRTQYTQEQRMMNSSKKSGSGMSDIYVPKLWCFSQLSFLKTNTKMRASGDNVEQNHLDDEGNFPQSIIEDESLSKDRPRKKTRPTYADSAIYNINGLGEIFEDAKFDKSLNTVLYLHGYLENPDVESVHILVDAYLTKNDVNLIVLDWGELADGNYAFDAVINAKQLGPVLAKELLTQFDSGLDINKFHIVGHSLGGQMAGIVGREIHARSNKTKSIKRISALDPAFPLFYMGIFANHLNKNDAEFVDVIHTDAWIYGAPVSTGTVDFWPNSGKTLQPGCPKRNYKMLSDNDLSSHRRSWWFWAESVAAKYDVKFNAVKAKSWSDFKNGKVCYDDEVVVSMGHDCPLNVSGDYFLQTNGSNPYARGILGTKYIDPKELPGYKCDDSDEDK